MSDNSGVWLLLIPLFILIVATIICVFLVASCIATSLGLHGIMWWAVVIVVYLLIMAILGIGRRG